MNPMRWHTPKGTIELAPVEETAVQQDDRSIPVAGILKDAMAHFNGNRLVEAAALCQAILRQYPEHADTLHLLGVVHHTSGQHIRAIELLNKAIQINPNEPRYLNDIGEAHRAIEQFSLAADFYRKAIALNPKLALAHNNLGIALFNMGQLDDAIGCYKTALQLKPDYFEVLNNLGGLMHEMGNNKEAANYFDQALTLRPESAEVYRNLTLIDVPAPEDDKTANMQQLINRSDISDSDAMHLHFALGKVFEKAKHYDPAFEHYLKGNALKRKTINFTMDQYTRYADGLINMYTKEFFANLSFHGSDSDRPVFIVGMPRSGTTLVEQIVSSHPQVFGAGELIFLQNIEQLIARQIGSQQPYPACMTDMNAELAQQLAGQYLEQLNAYSADAPHVTDKMPGNYQRIGLIKTLFPNARIIHCRRQPLDTCVSIFCNYFRGTHNYAYDLTELGLFYRQYERLMAHWQTLFGDAVFEVQYEELTQNQEAVSRALIDYLGLDWDPACLEFYNNKRPVQTASNLQVTKPMYATSVDKWKHYDKYLGPLKEALGDVLATNH